MIKNWKEFKALNEANSSDKNKKVIDTVEGEGFDVEQTKPGSYEVTYQDNIIFNLTISDSKVSFKDYDSHEVTSFDLSDSNLDRKISKFFKHHANGMGESKVSESTVESLEAQLIKLESALERKEREMDILQDNSNTKTEAIDDKDDEIDGVRDDIRLVKEKIAKLKKNESVDNSEVNEALSDEERTCFLLLNEVTISLGKDFKMVEYKAWELIAKVATKKFKQF